jgi:hypothetical protein
MELNSINHIVVLATVASLEEGEIIDYQNQFKQV